MCNVFNFSEDVFLTFGFRRESPTRFPYPHVVNQVFRGQKSFGHVVAVVFALVAVMVVKDYSVPIVCCAFALSGPVRLCWVKVVQKRRREDPIF